MYLLLSMVSEESSLILETIPRQTNRVMGYGQKLLKTLNIIAVNTGCFKTILNCSPRNEGSYGKCGYDKAGTEYLIILTSSRSTGNFHVTVTSDGTMVCLEYLY